MYKLSSYHLNVVYYILHLPNYIVHTPPKTFLYVNEKPGYKILINVVANFEYLGGAVVKVNLTFFISSAYSTKKYWSVMLKRFWM